MYMTDEMKRLPARFYSTASGREPVREWLLELPVEDRKIIGTDIKAVEYGWPIGMPLVRSLGDGLWEVRSNLTSGRIGRVLFCVTDECMVLLLGFVKKSRKTPKQDIAIARRRRAEL